MRGFRIISGAVVSIVAAATLVAGGCAGTPQLTNTRSATPAYSAMRTEAVLAQPGEADTTATSTKAAAPASAPAPKAAQVYGDQDSTWWSMQGGVAFAQDATDVNGRLSLHHFIADDFEVNGSLGAWGHFQDSNDQASGAFDLGFRWHFINRGREYADGSGMTVYAESGIGMLYATGEVPAGGTRYDFTPRAGIGATWPLGDGPTRLDLGLRWQHFSNGSSSGSDDNPSRDSAMVYFGVIFPF